MPEEDTLNQLDEKGRRFDKDKKGKPANGIQSKTAAEEPLYRQLSTMASNSVTRQTLAV